MISDWATLSIWTCLLISCLSNSWYSSIGDFWLSTVLALIHDRLIFSPLQQYLPIRDAGCQRLVIPILPRLA